MNYPSSIRAGALALALSSAALTPALAQHSNLNVTQSNTTQPTANGNGGTGTASSHGGTADNSSITNNLEAQAQRAWKAIEAIMRENRDKKLPPQMHDCGKTEINDPACTAD